MLRNDKGMLHNVGNILYKCLHHYMVHVMHRLPGKLFLLERGFLWFELVSIQISPNNRLKAPQ